MQNIISNRHLHLLEHLLKPGDCVVANELAKVLDLEIEDTSTQSPLLCSLRLTDEAFTSVLLDVVE